MKLLDRKFITMCVDAVFSVVVLVAGWYLVPNDLDKVTALVAILQPIALGVVAAFTVEEAQALKAGVHPMQIGKK